MKIPAKHANHIVGRISGVTENDTRIQAAEKTLVTMKMAGFSKSAIAKAERMIADAKARGIK